MTDQTARGPRWVPAVIIVALVAVIGVVLALALTAGGAPSSSPTASGGPASTPTQTPTPLPVKSGTPTPIPTSTSTPTPQPTKTAAIAKPAPQTIVKKFTASVVKMQAVKGIAEGPGEIGGPSVRFTIRLENTTGKTVSLTDTVVNAYYGKADTPAVSLRLPGGKNFPKAVKDGDVATGVYLFNIPKKDRGNVQITVDTSVRNPVVAFRGPAPKS